MAKYSKKERETHLENWSQSNLNKKAYCDRAGLPYGTFYNWTSQIKGPILPKKKSSKGSFVSLSKVSQLSDTEILLPNGVRLYLRQELTSELLELLRYV